MILINAENLVFGRIATYAAQKALAGEDVAIVNAEKAILSGTKEFAMKKIKTRMEMRGKGNPEKGPQYSKMPDKILRTAIRKMLPKTNRGKKTLSKIKVYIGFPEELQKNKPTTIEEAKAKNLKTFVLLGDICKLLGAKW
ncbi:MAG: 50S ribosomal protein L13 [Candidatus Diapherotrites archaeon]|nr:50S ribosomal protein L13 [Candidatus Diapherotrites archaeon]